MPTDRENKTHTTLPDIFRTINGVNLDIGPQDRITNADKKGDKAQWGRESQSELAPAGFPRIVLRDALGYELDTFTTLQEAIYRAKWQVKQTGQAKTPLQWRLPKAPAPARPDLSRTFPPLKHPPVETELDKLKKRHPYSSVLEFDVEDVGFVKESLQYLPYVPSLSFLRQEFLCGPKTYFQIVGTMLLHKRVLSFTEKRNAVYNFPGFCSGCVRLGLCYGCERSSEPHYHEDKPVKTGGGFTYFKKDRPEKQIKARNPVNWKIHNPDQALKMMMEEYAGVDLDGDIPEEIKKHLDKHGGHRERNFSQIPDFAKEMAEYNKKMSEPDEQNKPINDGADHDESFLPDVTASNYPGDHNASQGQGDTASRVRNSRSYVKFQSKSGIESDNDLDLFDVMTDRNSDDFNEVHDQISRHGYQSDPHGNYRLQNRHRSKDSKGRSRSEEVHSKRDIIKIDDGKRSSSYGREQHRQSKQRKTTVRSDDEKTLREKAGESDSSGSNERSGRQRERLYKAPPQFKLKRSPTRKIESKSPFSTDRKFNINSGSGFQLKKSNKGPTQFKAFRNVDTSWKEPKKFELKDNTKSTTKFWSPTRKRKDEKKSRSRSPRARRRASPLPQAISPDSGLDSELMTVVVKKKSPGRNKKNSRKISSSTEWTAGNISPSPLPTSQIPLDNYHDTAAEYYKNVDIDIARADAFYRQHERVRNRGRHKLPRLHHLRDSKDDSDSDENWRQTSREVKRLYMNESRQKNDTMDTRNMEHTDKQSNRLHLPNIDERHSRSLLKVSRSDNDPISRGRLEHETRRPRTGEMGTQTEESSYVYRNAKPTTQNMFRSHNRHKLEKRIQARNADTGEIYEEENDSSENPENEIDGIEQRGRSFKNRRGRKHREIYTSEAQSRNISKSKVTNHKSNVESGNWKEEHPIRRKNGRKEDDQVVRFPAINPDQSRPNTVSSESSDGNGQFSMKISVQPKSADQLDRENLDVRYRPRRHRQPKSRCNNTVENIAELEDSYDKHPRFRRIRSNTYTEKLAEGTNSANSDEEYEQIWEAGTGSEENAEHDICEEKMLLHPGTDKCKDRRKRRRQKRRVENEDHIGENEFEILQVGYENYQDMAEVSDPFEITKDAKYITGEKRRIRKSHRHQQPEHFDQISDSEHLKEKVYKNYQDDVEDIDSSVIKEAKYRDRQKRRTKRSHKYQVPESPDQVPNSEHIEEDVKNHDGEENTDIMSNTAKGTIHSNQKRRKNKSKHNKYLMPESRRQISDLILGEADLRNIDFEDESNDTNFDENENNQRTRMKKVKPMTRQKHLHQQIYENHLDSTIISDNDEVKSGCKANRRTDDRSSKQNYSIGKVRYMKDGKKSKVIEDWLNKISDSEVNTESENENYAENEQNIDGEGKPRTKNGYRKRGDKKKNRRTNKDLLTFNDNDVGLESETKPEAYKHRKMKKNRKVFPGLVEQQQDDHTDMLSEDKSDQRNRLKKRHRNKKQKENAGTVNSKFISDSTEANNKKQRLKSSKINFEERTGECVESQNMRENQVQDIAEVREKRENTFDVCETDESQSESISDDSYDSQEDHSYAVGQELDQGDLLESDDESTLAKPEKRQIKKEHYHKNNTEFQGAKGPNHELYRREDVNESEDISAYETSVTSREETESDVSELCFSPPAIPSEINFEKQSLTSCEPDLELTFDDVIDIENVEVVDNEDEDEEMKKAEERRRRRHRHKRKKRREAERLKEIESIDNNSQHKDSKGKQVEGVYGIPQGSDGEIDNQVLEQVANENREPQYGNQMADATLGAESEEENEFDEEIDQEWLDLRGRETRSTNRSTRRKSKKSTGRKSTGRTSKERNKDKQKSHKSQERSSLERKVREKLPKESSSLERKSKDRGRKSGENGNTAGKPTTEIEKVKIDKRKKKRIMKDTGDDDIDFATLPSIQSQLSKIMKGLSIAKPDTKEKIVTDRKKETESETDDEVSTENLTHIEPEAKWEQIRPKSVEIHDIGNGGSGFRKARSQSMPLLTDLEEMFKQMDQDLIEQLKQPFIAPIYFPGFRPGRIKKQFNPNPRRVKGRERSMSVSMVTNLFPFAEIEDSTVKSELDTLKEEPLIIPTPTPEPEPEPPKMDGAPTPLSLQVPTPDKPQTPPKRREIVKKERKEPKPRAPAPKPPIPVREPTPSPQPSEEEPVVTSREISFVFEKEPVIPELPPIEVPALPDIPETKPSHQQKAKKEMRLIEVAPELPEAKKKLPPPPKLGPKLRPHRPIRKSKVAEAPVTSQELQQLSDPLDFLAKYCIINPDRLPFYERIFNGAVSVQTPRYSRDEPMQPGDMVHLPPAVLSEHELNMLRDLTVLSHAQTPRREGISAPEQYLEKLNYTVEFVKGKQETIQEHMQKLQGEKIHYMATLAKEMDRDIGRLDYKVKGKKKKKKKKKKVDIVDYDKVGAMSVNLKDFKPTKMSDITDEVIVSRMNDKMMKKVKKDPVVKTLTLEISRDIEKLKHFDQRIAQIEDEKDLVGLYCMDYYFSEQATSARPQEFRRQQSRLYQKLHPDPDIEMNIEEVEMALQQINNKLLTEKEFQYIYFILDLPKRQKINFRLFSIIAALSEKVTQMDPMIRKLINKADYNALDVKMEKSKELFDLLQDVDVMPIGNAPADNLAVELTAGGLTPEHTNYVLSKFDRNGKGFCDFMDFVTYVPLFVQIHKRIIDDPFNDSLDV